MMSQGSIIAFVFCAFIAGMTGTCTAQELNEEPFKALIRGAILMANFHLPGAAISGKLVAVVPAWGFDVDCFFTRAALWPSKPM